jgi:hypothetical protein
VAVYTVTNHNPSIQSFDRVISPAARAIVARVDGEKWRFFITSEQLTKITIEQKGMLGSFPTKQNYIAPNSSIEIQGRGSVEIFAENLGAVSTAVRTWNGGYLCGGLEPVEFAEDGLTTPAAAAWGNLGSFGGFPAPFTNRCRLYTDTNQTRVRATAPNGLVVFSAGPQPVDERLYIDLDTPQGYLFEIRESVAGAGINYGVIWYRG